MPVDEAVRLPSTPLPADELEGELGGHSLQLVKELNAFAAAHEALQAAHDALEAALGQNEALDASEGQLAEVDTRLTAALEQVADDANQGTISAVDALAAEIADDLGRVADDAAGYADASATLMRDEVARSADDVTAAAISALDALANEVDADLDGASEEAAGYAATVATDLRVEIAQAKDDQGALLASEVDTLNERIGKIFPKVQTTDGVATDLVPPIAISPYLSALLEVRILAQRPDRLERAMYTIEALAHAVPSSDVLTLAVLPPTATETVEVGGVTYTWFADPTGVPNAVDIGATIEISIDNLVAAINLSGTDDLEYGAGTVKNPLVSAVKATALTMEAVAFLPGVAGDLITATEGMLNGAWTLGGGVLGGGSDMTVTKFAGFDRDDVEDEPTWDKDVVAGTGSTVEVKGTGEAGVDVDWLTVIRMTVFDLR